MVFSISLDYMILESVTSSLSLFLISSYLVIHFCVFITEIIACASDPCQNGATCFDNNGGSGYACLCTAGFEGTNCETGTISIHFYSINLKKS